MWRKLSAAEARAHSAFGIGGWVALIGVVAFVNATGQILQLSGAFDALGRTLPVADWPPENRLLLMANAACSVAFVFGILSRNMLFQIAAVLNLAVVCLGAVGDLSGFIDPQAVIAFDQIPPERAEAIRAGRGGLAHILSVAATAAFSVLIAAYAFLAPRPNVTFLRREWVPQQTQAQKTP